MLTTLELAYNTIGERPVNPSPNPNPNPSPNPNISPSLGDRGAAALALALGQNRTLTALDIAGNGIGIDGGQARTLVTAGRD